MEKRIEPRFGTIIDMEGDTVNIRQIVDAKFNFEEVTLKKEDIIQIFNEYLEETKESFDDGEVNMEELEKPEPAFLKPRQRKG